MGLEWGWLEKEVLTRSAEWYRDLHFAARVRGARPVKLDCRKCTYNLLDRRLIRIYNTPMITYDEAKRAMNLQRHGFDFVGSEVVFAGFTVTREDGRDAYGEIRMQTLGLWNGVVVFVVHTPPRRP